MTIEVRHSSSSRHVSSASDILKEGKLHKNYLKLAYINILKPSGNFTHQQV
jgi:hypothetical protein